MSSKRPSTENLGAKTKAQKRRKSSIRRSPGITRLRSPHLSPVQVQNTFQNAAVSTIPFPGKIDFETIENGLAKDVRTSSLLAEQPETPAVRLWDRLEECNIAVTAATIDFETLSINPLHGTTITPSDIVKGLQHPDIFYHVWVAVKRVIGEGLRNKGELTEAAMEQLLAELGSVILDRVSGPHLTFIDPRSHNDSSEIIGRAKRLIARFEKLGLLKDRIVISIPATEDGIDAARELESSYNILTNLTLVSGLMHAAACAGAGATTATISVGPILEWHEKKRKIAFQDLNPHPGMETIQSTLAYFDLHKVKTRLIGSNFRDLAEISPLGGLDAVSLSRAQIEDCRWSVLPLFPPPPDSSLVSLRARQAQYPVTPDTGIMATMSTETRSMVSAILYFGLGQLMVEMEVLEGVIEKEVERQVALETMDLRTLYGRTTSPRNGKNRPCIDEEGKNDPRLQASFPSRRKGNKVREIDDDETAATCSQDDTNRELIEGIDYF